MGQYRWRTTEHKKGVVMSTKCNLTPLMLHGQLFEMHHTRKYHEHSYLISLLFAAPFLLLITKTKKFKLVAVYKCQDKYDDSLDLYQCIPILDLVD